MLKPDLSWIASLSQSTKLPTGSLCCHQKVKKLDSPPPNTTKGQTIRRAASNQPQPQLARRNFNDKEQPAGGKAEEASPQKHFRGITKDNGRAVPEPEQGILGLLSISGESDIVAFGSSRDLTMVPPTRVV